MIKKLFILCFIIGCTSTIQAHCGSCGVGDEKKSHSHVKEAMTIDDLNLTKKQMKKYEVIENNYQKSLAEIQAKYEKELLTILTKKQTDIYEKNDVKCFTCKN